MVVAIGADAEEDQQGDKARRAISERFSVEVENVTVGDPSQIGAVLEGANILLNSGPAGVLMVPKAAWWGRPGLQVAVDLNAVSPLGVEGVDLGDAGEVRAGVSCFGAFGVGNFKTKLHKRCVAKLFERNDHVLDAETILEAAREML